MEKKMENEMETWIMEGLFGWYFLWGYFGIQFRVRFYPPFGV